MSSEFLEDISGEGRLVVTACDINEVSLESHDVGHGLFTHYLIEGLKGVGDKDQDGLVTVHELYDYVYENVSQHARKLGGSMHPIQKGSIKGKIFLSQYETSTQKQAKSLNIEAQSFYNSGELGKAYNLWQHVLKLMPEHEQAKRGIEKIDKLQHEERRKKEEQLERKLEVLLNLYNEEKLPSSELDLAIALFEKSENELNAYEIKVRRLLDDLTDEKISLTSFLRSIGLLRKGTIFNDLQSARKTKPKVNKDKPVEIKIDGATIKTDQVENEINAKDQACLNRWQESERRREKLTMEITALQAYKNFPVEEKEVFFQLMYDYDHHDKLRTMLANERAEIEAKLIAGAESSKLLRVPEDLWKNFMFEDFLTLRGRWEATFQENIDNKNAKHAINDSLKKAGLNESELASFAGLDWRQLEQLKTLEAKVKEEEAEIEDGRAAYDQYQKNRERWGGFAKLSAVVAIIALVADLISRLFSSDSNAFGIILPTCLAVLLCVFVLHLRWGARSKELGAWLIEVEDRYMEDRLQLREVLMQYQVPSIQQLEQLRLQFEELAKILQKDKKLKEDMGKIEHLLNNWVTAIGVYYITPETLNDAEKRFRESQQIWTEKYAYQQRLAQIDEKQKQIETILSRISLELEEIFQKAGITEPVGEKAFQSFLNGCQKREYLESLQMQLQQAEALGIAILEVKHE